MKKSAFIRVYLRPIFDCGFCHVMQNEIRPTQ